MNVLLIPMGTPGDIQPFIELGIELRRRGHAPKVLVHANHRGWVERHGLGFVELGPVEEYDRLLADRNLWNMHKAPRVFAKRLVLPTMRRMYDAIDRERQAGPLVVVGQTLALGARLAHEKLGVPLVTIHRQPASLRSLHDTPLLPYFLMGPRVPRWLKRVQYRLLDASLEHRYALRVNASRAELGLPPVRRVVSEWSSSPQLSLCFWPDWFAAPQPDWPANTLTIGFDVQTQGEREPDERLVRFLEAGDKPILFTAGSGMRHGRAFYEASAEACARIGRRGLLVTRAPDQVPASLPDGVMHVEYAPFNWLLPRCAAAVHHAGIGTCAQALAAGVPQLCMPGIVFDTPDNAVRLRRLGVARIVPAKRYTAPRVARELATLLADPAVPQRCAELAERVRREQAVTRACEQIERLAAQTGAAQS